MDLSQYAELFLAESRDHLSTINQQLLEWERSPQAREPVHGIFRAMHTVKGMAAAMGYATVAEVAHGAENLLDLLRGEEHAVDDDTFELLFQTADALEKAIAAQVAGREPDAQVAQVVKALEAAAQALEPAAGRRSGKRHRPSAPFLSPQLAGPGRRVHVRIDPDSALKGARATIVLRRMEAIGRVHAVQPAPSVLESDEFDGVLEFRVEAAVDNETIEKEIREAGDVQLVTIGDQEATRAADASDKTRHIRVDLRRLDQIMDLLGELGTARDRLAGLAARSADTDVEDAVAQISQLTSALQAETIEARMTPVWQVFDRFPRIVRDLARQLGKQVDFRLEGKEIELDRAILDEIVEPLVHLLRNGLDHGLETPEVRMAAGKPPTGLLTLSAMRERATVVIRIADNGRGIDREDILADARAAGVLDDSVDALTDEMLLKVLARPGFSTVEEVSDVSGRGVGIDVVVNKMRSLGGTLELSTVKGEGSAFTLRLPTTLAILRALIADVGGERYALPITHVAETLDLQPTNITELNGRDGMLFRDSIIPLVHLRDVVGTNGEAPPRQPVIVLQIGERRSGLVVDALAGQQEIVVKSFDPPRGTLPIFSGATVLRDGAPVLILDAGGLL